MCQVRVNKCIIQSNQCCRFKYFSSSTELRRQTTKALATCSKSYVNNQIGDSLKTNPKRFWTFIKANKRENIGIPTLRINDKPITNYRDKANALNNQFTSVFTSERYPIPVIDPSLYSNMPPLDIGTNGIIKQLKNLNQNKATGTDELPARVLKETAEQIAPIITHIFQQSYNTSNLPNDWLQALVTPIHTKSFKSDLANHRPISLTCILCKVMEHIIVSNIWKHLHKHDIILHFQHGFQSGLSCESQLIETVHDWMTALDNKTQFLLDFAKAFDKVPHKRLLPKLTSYGITSNTHTIGSHLFYQIVSSESRLMEPCRTSHICYIWCPTGLSSGTYTLLAVHQRHQRKNVQSSIRLFADDSIIYRKINSNIDHQILQTDLIQLEKWSVKWQMQFNISKCVHLPITNKTKPSSHQYSLFGDPLSKVASHSYLGVKLDSKLSWAKHITEMTSKSLKALGMVKRTLGLCKPEVKYTAYNMLVRPKLEYASPIWNPHTSSQINHLERIQHYAARFVANDHRRTTSPSTLVLTLNWQTLERRRMIKQAMTFYKILNNIIKINPPAGLLTRSHSRHHYRVPRSRLHTVVESILIYPRAIRIWNTIIIPKEITEIKQPESFQAAINKLPFTTPIHLKCL